MSLRQSAMSLNDRSSQQHLQDNDFNRSSTERLPQHDDNMGQHEQELLTNRMRLQPFTDDLNSEGNLISINEEDQNVVPIEDAKALAQAAQVA